MPKTPRRSGTVTTTAAVRYESFENQPLLERSHVLVPWSCDLCGWGNRAGVFARLPPVTVVGNERKRKVKHFPRPPLVNPRSSPGRRNVAIFPRLWFQAWEDGCRRAFAAGKRRDLTGFLPPGGAVGGDRRRLCLHPVLRAAGSRVLALPSKDRWQEDG